MLALAALATLSGRARAQVAAPGVSNEMRAEYLFRQGEKKFDSGKYEEACADFGESLRLGPKLGTLLNLALCHETIGKTATAWNEFHHGAAWAAQNGQKDRRDFAMQHAAALETRLPRVLLQLPAGHAIASVDVDGEPLPDSHWYMPIFLDPGDHSVTISAPGKQRSTVRFRVTNSPTEQLVSVPSLADDLAIAPPPAPPAPAPEDPDRSRRIAGYVTAATGALGLALGLTYGLLAVEKRNEIGDQCAGIRCTAEGLSLYDSAQSRATVATAATVIGVAATTVGVWLVVTSRPAQSGKPRADIGVRPRLGGAELGLGGTF
ncbi:MAG: tetratricopeptide repeat protein [Labilithrix sp.]|nr:tetratricopeptide repeat protein [Labilithrix sp.]